MLWTILKKLYESGCAGTHDANLSRSVRIVNFANLVATTMATVAALAYMAIGEYRHIWTCLPFPIMCAFNIYLNARGWYKGSRFSFMLVANFGIFCGCVMLGYEAGLQLLFFCTLIFSYTIYTAGESRQVLLFTCLPLALFLAIEFSPDTLAAGHVHFPDNYRREIGIAIRVYSTLTIGTFCYMIHRIIVGMHQRILLEEQNRVEQAKLLGLSGMSGGLAHEINNPLAIIAGRTEQVMHYLKQGSFEGEAIERAHRSVLDAVARIAHIVKILRGLARHSAEDTIPHSLNAMISDLISLCRDALLRHDIRLDYVPPKETIVIDCRPSELMQAIMNVINNALDAVCQVEERWIAIQIATTDLQVSLRIIDSGKGIAPALRRRIMEPFFTTKEVGKGTGTGLSIALATIENHQGRLYLDAGYPQTCFVVVLPRSGLAD